MWHAWERREKCTRFWWENPKETDHLEDRCGWDGKKMDPRETDWEGVEWIHLAQDWDWWQAVVNTMMNLQVLAPRNELHRKTKV
jgi:hypothetical protein